MPRTVILRIDIVGPLPAPLQVLTRFSAGVTAGAANAEGAAALLELLRSARSEMIEMRDAAGGLSYATMRTRLASRA